MPRARRLPLLALACLAALSTASVARADTPNEQTLYSQGPTGRYLLDGPWLRRLDPGNQGLSHGYMRQADTAGWERTTVPNAWNATDESEASFMGGVGWYRKDFTLPSAKKALTWVARFESVNYRSRVWLNGRPIGKNSGAYLPFEFRIPPAYLKRGATNRLVVRVENRRNGFDFPPAGLSVTGTPTGGWWNYGGILREVYLRKVDHVDIGDVMVQPDLPCASCAATVSVRTTVRNLSDQGQRVRVTGSFGTKKFALGTVALPGRSSRALAAKVRIGDPKLWQPGSPNLYDVQLTARGGKTVLQRYRLKTGIRSVKVVDGRILLNGKPIVFRGVGLHEDDRQLGFAIDNAVRDRYVAEVQEIGANIVRSHYPLHPYLYEQFDRLGILAWSEIPVYAVKTKWLKSRLVRTLAARELETNIKANGTHPSIITWSIGNELSSRPGAVQGYYIARAVRSAKALDPTRPVSLAVAGYPAAGCQSEYAPLDILGINEYFGWYPGPNGQIADRTSLSGFLDAVRQCYPDKAIAITEFGAEANRDGPVEEKGTFQFQQDFASYHLGVYATKPWLSGAIWWGLEEFRVRPGWDGGNPRPQSPVHQKGLITFDAHAKKPAWADIARNFHGTPLFR
jgi:beta-glucuronidase